MSSLPRNISFQRVAIKDIKSISDVVKWLSGFIKELDRWYSKLYDWIENSESEKSWAFESAAGSTGIFYFGGFYFFNSGNSTFVVAQNLGTANVSYAAHAFIVADSSPASDSVIRVSGVSITDDGTRTPGDTEDIDVLATTAADAYFETEKKWLGTVTLTFISGDNTVNYNWGYAKYWDNNNKNFRVTGVEFSGLGGANDANPDFAVIHHKASGWTYNLGSIPTPPTAFVRMSTDHATDDQIAASEPFAYKRSNLSEAISGSESEGTIIEITTTANRAIEQGNVLLRVKSN